MSSGFLPTGSAPKVLVRGSEVVVGEGFDRATTARFVRANLRRPLRKPD